MLDPRLLRVNFEEVKRRLETRGGDFSYLDEFPQLDERRRQIIGEVEELKAKRNSISKLIGQYKREKKDAQQLMDQMAINNERIKELDAELKNVESKITEILLNTPNLPHESVPRGTSDEDNVEIRRFGEPTRFAFEPKPHWELAAELDLIDFERAGKISGSRFAVYKGLGAKLERALINFMLDVHTEQNGYFEILPPVIVNRDSMTGTGQLPKFEEDAFKLYNNPNYFLIPTAE